MEILLISRCPPFPMHYGDRLIPYHLARELSARRHVIDLLAFYQLPEDIADVPRYEHFFRSVKLIPEPRRTNRDYLRRSRRENERFPSSAKLVPGDVGNDPGDGRGTRVRRGPLVWRCAGL